MKVQFVRAGRRIDWPGWAIAAVVVWIGLVATAVYIGDRLDRDIKLCVFNRVTGVPCPGCGMTRAAQSVLAGRILQGWLYNPLVSSFMAMLAATVLLRALFARRMELNLSKRQTKAAWIIIAALFTANWIYLIVWVG